MDIENAVAPPLLVGVASISSKSDYRHGTIATKSATAPPA
jgi:hypothetical protein